MSLSRPSLPRLPAPRHSWSWPTPQYPPLTALLPLLCAPTPHGSSFALDMAYDETMLSAQVITVQAALLYTSSNGERRIRVHTMVLPVTQVRVCACACVRVCVVL